LPWLLPMDQQVAWRTEIDSHGQPTRTRAQVASNQRMLQPGRGG
jgi:hypothetical protein